MYNRNEIWRIIMEVYFQQRDLLKDNTSGTDAIYDFKSALFDAFGICDIED